MLALHASRLAAAEAAAIGAEVDAAMADAVRAVSWIGTDRVPPSSPAARGATARAPCEPMCELLINPELFSMADLLALARHSAGATLLPLDSALQVLRARVGAMLPAAGGPGAAPPSPGANGLLDGAEVGAAADGARARHGEATAFGAEAVDAVPADIASALQAANRALRACGAADDSEDNDAEDAEVEAVIASALSGGL